jgi:acyl-CoA thioester hydrolase
MRYAAPFICGPQTVEQAWIDYNGHLNMAYYNVLFDRSVDVAFLALGMGPDYAASRRLTTYAAEAHVCYVREVHAGDIVTCTFRLMDHDEKRLHTYGEMFHSDGWLAATCETMTLHVDMTGPRVTPFPEDIAANVAEMARAHAALPRPERVGKGIAIRRKVAS